MARKRRSSPWAIHPLHAVITIAAIAAGAMLAFSYTDTASGVGPPCPYTCQNSTHTKQGQTTSCSPDLPTVQKEHPVYVKLKNKQNKTPQEEQQFQKAKAALKQCADENLNNCAGTTSGSGASRNACDKDPGKGLPKDDKKDKKDDGKPPEMPKPPEGGKPKDDKPKEDQCQMNPADPSCCKTGTEPACKKDKTFSDTLKSAWDSATNLLTGTSPTETNTADELLKDAQSDPAKDETPKTTTTPPPANTNTGNTNGPNPLEQQKNTPPVKNADPHSKGGANTFNAAEQKGYEAVTNTRANNQGLNAINALRNALRNFFRALGWL